MKKKSRRYLCGFFLLLALLCLEAGGMIKLQAQGTDEIEIEFYYENVCASCEGDSAFFKLYQECLTQEEKEVFRGKAASYNIFLDSCKERYQKRREALGIPEGTELPVLVIAGRWVSGLDKMEELLHEVAANAVEGSKGTAGAVQGIGEAGGEVEAGDTKDAKETALLVERLEAELEAGELPTVLLFTTESCEDCERVKEWLERQEDGKRAVLECNIIREPWVDFLKSMFLEYGIEEGKQKVPALFYGDHAWTSAEDILALEKEEWEDPKENDRLLFHIQRVGKRMESGQETGTGNGQNLWTLAGAGLLAGLNPCSISMLLMLLSMVVAEKASVWKNGLLYLGGKYAAYSAIGMAIYVSAAELDAHLLSRAGYILNGALVFLFVAAGVLYLVDAVRVFHQEYGEVRTQLPTGMRKWNHRLIRRVGNYTGMLKPLLVLGLGMAISVGEFFCTGQIYMASITYLLKDQVRGVWPYFLAYVTAMSLPAFLMLMVIQKTRNTEHVSEFMLRHLGAVKIFNALLFFGYAIYFLLH